MQNLHQSNVTPWKIKTFTYLGSFSLVSVRECVRNLDMRVQVHSGELWISKQRVHIVLEASKSAGAKGDVPKICGFVHPMHIYVDNTCFVIKPIDMQ